MKLKYKVHDTTVLKGHNRKILIFRAIDPVLNSPVIIIKIKRLIDFKTRDILEVDHHFTIKTFLLLTEMFELITNSDEFKRDYAVEIKELKSDLSQLMTSLTYDTI